MAALSSHPHARDTPGPAAKTVGQQAREFRRFMGWTTTQMAKQVGTSRQSIESLERVGDRLPPYLDRLAAVMGVSVDTLLHSVPLPADAQAVQLLEAVMAALADKRLSPNKISRLLQVLDERD